MVSMLRTNSRRQQWFPKVAQQHRLLSLSASPPYLNLTQEDLPKLPLARFSGDRLLISTPQEEQKYTSVINDLFKHKVLGFDSEWHHWRPRRTPSLVQLASEDVCIMWRLCYKNQDKLFVGADFPSKLLALLSNPRIIKVGHGSDTDAYLLLKNYYVNSCSVFDTYSLTKELGLPLQSLRGLAGTLLGVQVTKSQARTNWENELLSDSQLHYASTDAWISLKVYEALLQYAVAQGVMPASPANSAFQFVPTTKEKQHLKRVLRSVRLRRKAGQSSHSPPHTATTIGRTLNQPEDPAAERAAMEAETERRMGVLERIREVIDRFLSRIEAAEQSLPSDDSFPFSRATERVHTSSMDSDPPSDSKTTVQYSRVGSSSEREKIKTDPVTCWSPECWEVNSSPSDFRGHENLSQVNVPRGQQPVASVSRTQKGQSTLSCHKLTTVVSPGCVNGCETDHLYHVRIEASQQDCRDTLSDMPLSASGDKAVLEKCTSTSEQFECDSSECVCQVKGPAPQLPFEVNSSKANIQSPCCSSELYPQVSVQDNDCEPESSKEQERLTTDLVLS